MNTNKTIKQLRKNNKFTQQELSVLLGMSVRTYREKEIGNTPFTQLEIMKITMLFKLKQEQLFEIFFLNSFNCSFWINDISKNSFPLLNKDY